MAYINKIVVNGQEVNANQFEGILDKDGHARFVEGAITPHSDMAGLTSKYAKWSLSGTHLMLVIALSNETENAINTTTFDEVFSVELPEWIQAKIYPLNEEFTTVTIASFQAFNDTMSTVTTGVKTYLYKNQNKLECKTLDNYSWGAGYSFRLQFDLIIDNE